MSGTVTVTTSLNVLTAEGQSENLGGSQLTFTQTGKRLVKNILQTSTSEAAIPLPGGTLGWASFKNLDPTNNISLRIASGGVAAITLPPGGVALFPIGAGCTAPYAIASAGTPDLAYEILEA